MTEGDSLTPAQVVDSLKSDFSKLGALIKTLGAPAVCSGGDVTIRAHYLPFSGGKPRTGELLETIRGYICNFALSRVEIDEVHQKADLLPFQERMLEYNKLRDHAAELFIKAQKSTNRNGECGELILYLLTEWILEAPQVMAKMSLKTNAQMPVHGSDGIHVKYDDVTDKLVFLWGEAKLHKTIDGAMTSAVSSIGESLKYEKLKEDINLVRRYISLSGLSENAQKKIVEYLDPLSPKYDHKIDASVCLIGFNFDGFQKISGVQTSQVEIEFCKLLTTSMASAKKRLEKILANAGITHHAMEVFFLPVISVDQLRIDFQNGIGWKS